MEKRIFLTKIIIAQVVAFLISSGLNGTVFLKGTPIVRAYRPSQQQSLNPEVLPSPISTNTTTPPTGFPTEFPTSIPLITLTNTPIPTRVLPTLPAIGLPRGAPTIYLSPTARPISISPTQVPQPTSSPSTGADVSALESQTIAIINQRRKSDGLGELTANSLLTVAARRQSTDNAQNGQCDHYGSDGSDPFRRARDAGFTGSVYGETVACGATTPQEAVDLWWNSPPHHEILTYPSIKKIGLGWVNNYQTALVAF